jgi:hypothetical protein
VFTVTNGLAYCTKVLITVVESFIILAPKGKYLSGQSFFYNFFIAKFPPPNVSF